MSSETADRILEAACELIAEDGIDEVRIARVAQRAGASTSLVHHYFSTREELLEQALVHSFEQAGDERFGAEVGSGGAVEILAAAIDATRVIVTENIGDFARLLDGRALRGEPATPVVFVRRGRASGGTVAGRLARALDAWARTNPEPWVGPHWLSNADRPG